MVGLTLLISEAADLLALLDLGARRTCGGSFPKSENRLVSTSSWKMTKQMNMVGPCDAVTMMKTHWKIWAMAGGPAMSRAISQGRQTVVAMDMMAFISR